MLERNPEKQERTDMDREERSGERNMVERLEAAAAALEKTLSLAGRPVAAATALSGEVERISATVEQSRRETELAEKLAAVERELAEVKAARRRTC